MTAAHAPSTALAALRANVEASRLDLGLAFGRFTIALPRDARRPLVLGWFALGIAALAASGLLAVLLVASRTPGVAKLFPVAGFFQAALVAHVDLSVLVWFAACSCALWSANSTARWLPLGRTALAAAAVGAGAMAVAPFTGGTPIMANYVPVIGSPVFLGGLVLFGAGLALAVGRGLFASPRVGLRLDGSGALRFGLSGATVATAVAFLALAGSFAGLPQALDGKAYYELLFWGAGHVLQFAWTLVMLVGWLLLADATGARVPLSSRVVALLFGIGVACVFATPLIYLAWGVTSVEHHRLQTWLMRFGGALAIVPVAIAVAWALARSRGRPRDAAVRTLAASRYGSRPLESLVALMGVVYWALPRLGFAAPSPRLATWQAHLYSGGQLVHIVGLVWSGGYGVQRKVADGAVVERTWQQLAGMGLMGAGGMVAVVGGMLFVAIVAASVTRRPRAASP